ncbi:ABC transporter ATP-binding protein [Paenibacillus chitinolyticus]|uniref:ABC transporter ATP-binding protein n=1 Tax=Paenibacillus chitinolyticus TaxID=79263 RepID=A0A410WVF4_9BACL|nr:ABC transporter ATP-binding protein [Paenibacillus chitinolyticus]MCY9589277.1 ABC transporter ATP-binding protein/permease [Paenibacillus chitinolyticus]MCY9594350.1 ABC transporter ATP-binding protein/permease [Paenibacillus chitinolyticus]QAV18399.1 ABC transporter ATP-binding protein [Paenibacillus chitinolyticus]
MSNRQRQSEEKVNGKGAGSGERFVYQDDEMLEKSFDWGQFKRLAVYMKPYSKQIIPIVIVMMIVGAITKLSIPLIISTTIDSSLHVGGDAKFLFGMVALMLAVYIIQWLSNKYRIKYTSVIGQRVIYDLRHDLFRHIQRLSFEFFDKRPAGSVLVRVTNYVNSLQDLFTNGVVNMMIDCVQLVGIVIILLTINFKLGAAIIITVPLMFIVSSQLRKRVRRSWQTVNIKQSRLNAHLNECIQGIRVTQAYTQEKENIRFFEQMNEDNKQAWNRASKLNQSFGPIIEITGAIGYFILFWYGASLIQSGEITVGLLVAFASYIGNFWEPINRMVQMYSQLLVAMASAERIFEFMDEQPTVGEKENAAELPPIRGQVSFENIVFEYEKGRTALNHINVDVQPGQSIALVGHTGSGKSTIINLLCRFYDPTEGSVRIDGKDIRDVKLQSLRSQIGIVLQDTFIFSGTIRDNIRFGRLDATDEEVEAAAKAVHAHDFIVKLPFGYDTEVQERGNALSMGQRQLISFARALLADPAILILDEATASIDTETELRIQEALKTLLKGRTSFMVAHRLSTIRGADKIIVLDHGRIMETGDHDELMKHQGIYYGLIQAQYKFLQDAI